MLTQLFFKIIVVQNSHLTVSYSCCYIHNKHLLFKATVTEQCQLLYHVSLGYIHIKTHYKYKCNFCTPSEVPSEISKRYLSISEPPLSLGASGRNIKIWSASSAFIFPFDLILKPLYYSTTMLHQSFLTNQYFHKTIIPEYF